MAICCGKGNNAGDGLVIARHLDLRGIRRATFFLVRPDELTGDAAANFEIVRRADLPLKTFTTSYDADIFDQCLADADWIVDALLGTGARGKPRSPLDRVITQLNSHSAKKMAIDVPSGLDCDTGESADPTFRADHTCTFVAAKPGLLLPEARSRSEKSTSWTSASPLDCSASLALALNRASMKNSQKR